jgi:flagellar hook-basal body complex protein FliE
VNAITPPAFYPALPDDASTASSASPASNGNAANGSSFGTFVQNALGDAATSLGRADAAESSFARGRGGLQEMVLERAQADVVLSIATATVGRATQALTTILGMQI